MVSITAAVVSGLTSVRAHFLFAVRELAVGIFRRKDSAQQKNRTQEKRFPFVSSTNKKRPLKPKQSEEKEGHEFLRNKLNTLTSKQKKTKISHDLRQTFAKLAHHVRRGFTGLVLSDAVGNALGAVQRRVLCGCDNEVRHAFLIISWRIINTIIISKLSFLLLFRVHNQRCRLDIQQR
jgi:hypothetical protein